VLVRIQSKLEAGDTWRAVDGWSFAEFEVLPRVGEFVSLQHIAKQGVWLRVDHIVHTPNNVRPTSTADERPYQAILYVTWLSQDAVIAPGAPSAIIHWDGEELPVQLRDLPPGSYALSRHTSDAFEAEEDGTCIRAALKDTSGKHTLPAFTKPPRRWRQ
jgi:hypothetical protein